MKNIYLGLAILGTVVPYYFFIQFFQHHGVDLASFLNGLFVNGAAGGFSADLLITSSVFWLYMFQQQKDEKGPNPVVFIAINLFIGLSCALPAYLYFREE